MGARDYSQRTIKILFGESGNLCAFPKCNEPLIQDDVVLCDVAHILPASSKGPRGDSGIHFSDLNKPSNLLLLCLKHHRIVDDKSKPYPEELLRQYKTDHIKRISQLGVKYEISDDNLVKTQQHFTLSINHISESHLAVLQGLNNNSRSTIKVTQYIGLDPKALSATLQKYQEKIDERLKRFSGQLDKFVDKDQLTEALRDPSASEFVTKAFKAASLTEDSDLYQILAKAIQVRVNEGDSTEARKDVAFAQVPDLISKLTVNQMKLIAAHYVATNLSVKISPNLAFVDETLGKLIKSLGTVQYHVNDVGQIAGSGAATYISFMEDKAINRIQQHYEHLFINPIPTESVEGSEIAQELKDGFFIKVEAGYALTVPIATIEKAVQLNPSLVGLEAIKQLFRMQKLSDEEATEKIKSEAPYLYWLIQVNDTTRLANVELTLPGKALAVAVLEGLSGSSLSSIWQSDEDQISFPAPQ